MRKYLNAPDLGIIMGCLFVFDLFSLWNPEQWFNSGTISNIGEYTAILGLLAIAFVGLGNNNVSEVLAFVLAMLLVLLIGLANATRVIRGKLSSMIVTLGGLFFYRGFIYVTTHGAVTGHRRPYGKTGSPSS